MTHAETVRPSGETETHSLGYGTDDTWSDGEVTHFRAAIFGHLARLAAPILTDYRSDLFHDAAWLTEHFGSVVPFAFYWSCNYSGTVIGTDGNPNLHRANLWHFRVAADDRLGKVSLTITRVARETES